MNLGTFEKLDNFRSYENKKITWGVDRFSVNSNLLHISKPQIQEHHFPQFSIILAIYVTKS